MLSRGKRCSIAKILRQYRAVIFHEIQNLVSGGGCVSIQGPCSPLRGMLPSWMRPRCGMWVGRDEPRKLSVGLADLLAFLGRALWGIPAPRERHRCFECLIFLLYFSRKT